MNYSHASRTALILGGGGSTGNAWLIGVIAGLFEAGVDATTADLIVGTSAGATAAAQLTSAAPSELLAATLSPVRRQPPAPAVDGGRDPHRPVIDHMEAMTRMIDAAANAADLRRRLGVAALELDATSGGSWSARWRSTVATRLPSPLWPQQAVLITAINARSGAPVVFDRHSGVELVDAVAASTSSRFPFRIGDELYLDGGFRTNAENADLAAGYGRVLVLSPFGGRSLAPVEWGTHLETQLDELRADGATVETVVPDSDSEHLFGVNGMDLSLRPPAAQAGYSQGLKLAPSFEGFWR